ncbi:MAG TPA: type II CAAX endopeptidase family protein [bacterium]|nr:type II CAAX endopeptidase family protein [bacterium]HQP98939.1 type II CAAX endopeptidase family protein [bacterium]
MRNLNSFLYLVIVFFFAFLTASLLAPFTIRLIDSIAFLAVLSEYDPAKVFRRLVVVMFLVGLYLWRRRLAIPPASEIGLTRHSCWKSNLMAGICIGVLGLSLVQSATVVLGHRILDPERDLTVFSIVNAMLNGFCTAVVVGILEEIVFRGVLFHALLQRTGRGVAVIGTSLIFAALHYFRTGDSEIPRHSLWIGPLAAWELLQGWWDRFHLFPDFTGLVLVSVVLCWSVLLSRDIYTAIGLHAGWVFVIQASKRLFDRADNISPVLFGGSQLYDGFVTIVLLAGMIPFLHLCLRLGWFKVAPGDGERHGEG